MNPLLPNSAAQVFYDGIFTEPRLDHPESLTVGPDGAIWCGGEAGQIYRLDLDGPRLDLVASTGGFTLGLAHLDDGRLLTCDLKHGAVFQTDLESGESRVFATGAGDTQFRFANYVLAGRGGEIYVSDSHEFKEPGPGIFRFLPDGSGELWYDRPLDFANGMTMGPDGKAVYVVETFGRRISKIPITSDGSAGPAETVAEFPGALPDGIAFGPDGLLYVGCYEPSQICRVTAEGTVEVVVHDADAHTLCHPTDVAIIGSTLYATNLGRWHISSVDLSSLFDG
ncbi:MAG: SMP-30/gluconolactonase/LRE family protein [Acidimicrobiales bacterium]